MKLSDLLGQIIIPAWLLWAFFSLATFTAQLLGVAGSGLLGQLDLRLEANLAAWYAGAAFLLSALSCLTVFPFDRARGAAYVDYWAFRFLALGFVLLSALEVSQAHIAVSKWLHANLPMFGWPGELLLILFVSPLALAAWLYYLRFGLKRLTSCSRPRLALVLLSFIALSLPVWSYLSVIEKLTWGKQGVMTLFACVEESLETGVALAAAHLNYIFSQGFET